MKTLVSVAAYKRLETACFLREKLHNQNIDSVFVHFGSLDDKHEYTSVQVDPDDVEKVFNVMMEIREVYGKNIEEIEPDRSIRQILVPTDFSRGSEDACHYAVNLAEILNAELNLLHVFSNPISDVKMHTTASFEIYIKHILDEEEQRAKANMIYFSEKIKEYIASQKIKGVVVNTSIAMGNVVRTIKRVCNNCSPDLIVLGTSGSEKGSRSIFAAAAKELVNDLKIPLIAVPGQYTEEHITKMKILYATDFNEKDNNSLTQLMRITGALKKQVICVHIDTAHNPAKEEQIDDLNEMLEREFAGHDIQCRLIDYVNIFQGIRDFADANKMNMISFTVHKPGIFDLLFKPNLFKKILQEANLPILLFPS